MYPFEVPDEEGADFIGEDDVVPHVLEDDDAHDDAVDPPSQSDYRLSSAKRFGIVFVAKDQKTFKLVGQYGANFSSFVGELIKEIPHYYDSWEKVPPSDKAPLIPRLQTYFDLPPHLNDETVIKINGEDKTVGSLVRVGLQRDFARRYSDNKCFVLVVLFRKKSGLAAAIFLLTDLVSSSNIIAQSLLVATQADVIHVGFENRLRYFIETDTLNGQVV
ncbi:hypothetical protein Tco_0470664 [Tanacetum coccineum]